ncbi:MAG: PepSY domain-containing protein [bacterium]|nr:PepSY domain-containing protein [bacterium]
MNGLTMPASFAKQLDTPRRKSEKLSPSRPLLRRRQETFRKLHRYLGAGIALLLLLLAGSGFLLNHPELLDAPAEKTLSLAADPQDAERLLRGTRSGLYASEDGGKSWQEVPMLFVAERAVDIAFSPSKPKHVYVVLEDMGLIRSLDGGFVWEQVPLGFVPLAESVRLQRIAIHNNDRLSLWTSGGLLVSEDAGKTWVSTGHRPKPGYDLHTLVHQIHTGYFFAAWFRYLYDAAAWGLLVLICTGFLIWRRRNGKTLRAQ